MNSLLIVEFTLVRNVFVLVERYTLQGLRLRTPTSSSQIKNLDLQSKPITADIHTHGQLHRVETRVNSIMIVRFKNANL